MFRTLEMSAHDFLIADKREVRDYLLALNKHTPPHPRGKPYHNFDLLPPTAKNRLEQFRRNTSALRIRSLTERSGDTTGLYNHQIWDISQNVSHHPAPSSILPRPATSSMFWSEGKNRTCTPLELLHLQGAPFTEKQNDLNMCRPWFNDSL